MAVWVLAAVGFVVVLALGSCVALVALVGEAAEDVDRSIAAEQADEVGDVSEPRCSTDAAGFLTAEVDVTNTSSERSNYTIELAFESADGDQIDTRVRLRVGTPAGSVDRGGRAEPHRVARPRRHLPGQRRRAVLGRALTAGRRRLACPTRTCSTDGDVTEPLPGLYLVGCDAGGRGSGTHQAVDSGFNVARMVAADL